MNNLLSELQTKITRGDIIMKPKWQFMLVSALWVSGTLLATILFVYFVSFCLFVLKESGLLFAPGLGGRGLWFFIITSPWLLIGASALFFFLLYVLVSHYSFSYRRPLLYTLIGVITIALVSAYAIERTAIHHTVGTFAETHNLPLMAAMYEEVRTQRPEGVTVGRVSTITPNGFILTSEYDEQLAVIITDRTKQPPQTSYATNTPLIIFGKNDNGTITALGIRPVDRGILREHGRRPGTASQLPPRRTTTEW